MKISKIQPVLHAVENGATYFALFFLALIPTIEVVARKLFHTGLPNSTDYTNHLVLLLTFFSGMITSREGKHLTLSLNLHIPEPNRGRIKLVIDYLAVMVTAALAWCSLSFALNGFDPQQKVGNIPIQLLALVMAIGYGVMALRFIGSAKGGGGRRRWAALPLLLGTFLAVGPLVNVLAFFFDNLPSFLDSIVQLSQSASGVIALPLIVLLLLSAIFGAPIFVILGGIAFLLFARVGEPLEVIPNEAYSMLISHAIPAIPLFTVAGFLLSESKAGERLVSLFKSLFSWFPGGLAIMAILVCAFFTTFTGASGVTILALGGLLSYVLLKGKYKRNFSTGLLTASGSIGLLFPPSLPIIIYGVTAQISIKDMFIGGIIPGFVMILALVVFSIVYTMKNKVDQEPFRLKEVGLALKSSIWEILLPIIVILFYFGGIATLVESSAIAVIYVLIVEMIIKRDLSLKDLPRVFLKCLPIIGGVLTILALAKGLSYFIVDAEIPMKLTEWVQTTISSKYLFLFLLNIGLLITGCFMDIFSAILVVVPLIIPLGNIFGIHPVHLGIIFLANMELGYLTPPVGLNLFLASYQFDEPMAKLYRDVLPFFFIQLGVVLLITYLPFLSTGLLNLFK